MKKQNWLCTVYMSSCGIFSLVKHEKGNMDFNFQIFSVITGEYLFPELADLSDLSATLDSSRLYILLFFTGDNFFPEMADLSDLVANLDLSKLYILHFLRVINFPRRWLISAIFLRGWICPDFIFYSFTGDKRFQELADLRDFVAMLGLSKLYI